MLKEITQDASAMCKCERTARQGLGGAPPAPGGGGVGARALETRARSGGEQRAGRKYLFGALLLFHAVADHDVDGFPAEPLHDPLEAALLPCTRERQRGRSGVSPEGGERGPPAGRSLRAAVLRPKGRVSPSGRLRSAHCDQPL